MKSQFQPWQFLLLILAGWINRRQQDSVEYLITENRVLREQLGKNRILLNDDPRRRGGLLPAMPFCHRIITWPCAAEACFCPAEDPGGWILSEAPAAYRPRHPKRASYYPSLSPD